MVELIFNVFLMVCIVIWIMMLNAERKRFKQKGEAITNLLAKAQAFSEAEREDLQDLRAQYIKRLDDIEVMLGALDNVRINGVAVVEELVQHKGEVERLIARRNKKEAGRRR